MIAEINMMKVKILRQMLLSMVPSFRNELHITDDHLPAIITGIRRAPNALPNLSKCPAICALQSGQ